MILALVFHGRRLALLGLALCLLLQGCGGPVPETRVFSIGTDYEVAAQPTARPATLQIQPFNGIEVYTDRRIAWRDVSQPYEIGLMDHHLWSSAPTRLVQEQIWECVSRSGLYQNVVTTGISVRIDRVVQGEVRRFEFLTRGDVITSAVIDLDVVVIGRRPRTLLWQGRFEYDVPVAESTPRAAVGAMKEGLQQLCADMIGLLNSIPPQ